VERSDGRAFQLNVVAGIYIYMALPGRPQRCGSRSPNPAFLAAARRSLEPTAGDFEARQRQAGAGGTPATAGAAPTAAATASTLTQRRGAGSAKE